MYWVQGLSKHEKTIFFAEDKVKYFYRFREINIFIREPISKQCKAINLQTSELNFLQLLNEHRNCDKELNKFCETIILCI